LTQSAWAASRTKRGCLRALFYRAKGRRSWAKAVVATAQEILVVAYHILRNGTPYRDLGDDCLDRSNPARTAQRLLQRLATLDLQVRTPLPTLSTSPAFSALEQ